MNKIESSLVLHYFVQRLEAAREVFLWNSFKFSNHICFEGIKTNVTRIAVCNRKKSFAQLNAIIKSV